jgi:hypothetical protein
LGYGHGGEGYADDTRLHGQSGCDHQLHDFLPENLSHSHDWDHRDDEMERNHEHSIREEEIGIGIDDDSGLAIWHPPVPCGRDHVIRLDIQPSRFDHSEHFDSERGTVAQEEEEIHQLLGLQIPEFA